MRIEGKVVRGVTVVTISEKIEIDLSNAEEFKLAVLKTIGDANFVVLDAAMVDFFDSAGMASLLSVQRRLTEGGGTFALAGLNQAVAEIFRMIGFDIVFRTFPDVDGAIDAIRPQP